MSRFGAVTSYFFWSENRGITSTPVTMEKAINDAIARRTKWCAAQQIAAYAKIKDAIVDWTGEDGERLEIDLTEFVANMEEDRTPWLCEYIEEQLNRDVVDGRRWYWASETGDSVIIKFNFFD